MNAEFPVFNEFGQISLPTPKTQSGGLNLQSILIIGAITIAIIGAIYWFICLISNKNEPKEPIKNQDDSNISNLKFPPMNNSRSLDFGNGNY